jgi:hypothetical protein
MNLTVPGVGTSPGPAYASLINTDLSIIDEHDHSSGKGVQISPDGININGNLPFNNNNATTLRSVRFQAQDTPITGSSTADVGCTYVAGVDLYFNDGTGNQVRITSGGGVAGSPGSITNLTSPASAAYVAASSKFVWQSAANVAANMDMRSVILRNSGASSFGLTLSAPTLSSDTAQALPSTPGSTCFMTMDSSGNMSAGIPQALGITRAMQAAVGQQVSTSSGQYSTVSQSYTNVGSMSVTITTTGRPVMLMLIGVGAGDVSVFSVTGTLNVAFARGVTQIYNTRFQAPTSLTFHSYPSALSCLDPVAAGTYTYTLDVQNVSSGSTCIVSSTRLIAYEL